MCSRSVASKNQGMTRRDSTFLNRKVRPLLSDTASRRMTARRKRRRRRLPPVAGLAVGYTPPPRVLGRRLGDWARIMGVVLLVAGIAGGVLAVMLHVAA